jgi:NAD(P)-dependent dehydrogenase (short-subunit alcohol dehydrogenase family)
MVAQPAAGGGAEALRCRIDAALDLVVGEIEAAGGQAVARQADVSSLGEAAALGAWACQTYGRVDVLVNNAGHSSPNRTVWVEHEDWSRVVDVNLNGIFALTRAVLPTMVERGGGTVVTVTSLAALRPGLISGAAYGAAKAAGRRAPR